MWTTRYGIGAVLILVGLAGYVSAQQPPSYAKDVRPFLAKYCLECHNSKEPKVGLDLETYKGLRLGSDAGEVLTPGNPDASRIVLLVEGKDKPRMPPKKAKFHPKAEEVGVLRAWIAAGAKDDSAAIKTTLPNIKPRERMAAPVAALAYSPDGKLLAAAAYRDILLIEPGTGEVTILARGLPGPVTALAFSRDGKRLAAASGTTGATGTLHVWTVPQAASAWPQPKTISSAHQDVIQQLVFSPDGNVLATCGYDRQIKLWDTSTFKDPRILREHSDSVYGLSFSPDGKLFASGGADRAVKVWEASASKLLYTLGEATDWVYAVAWSPDGRHLAAAGVDKSIRVWEVSAEGGRVVHSVFAHESPIVRLAYSTDGKALYSLGEDRILKAWDADHMVERKVYERQAETVLALAVRPDQRQVALGRYDGALVLLDPESGKVQSQPLPVKPRPPEPTKLSPSWGQRGLPVRVLIEGKHLEGVNSLVVAHPGVTTRILPEGHAATALQAVLTFPADTPAGAYPLRLQNEAGQSAALPFTVDLFPQMAEQEPNNSPGTGQKIVLSATVTGSLDRAGDVDFYRFEATAGQEVGVQVIVAQANGKPAFEPFLQIADATGRVLVQNASAVLGYKVPAAGTYAIGIRDREFRGDATMTYRLHIGDVAVVTAIFPLGLQRGTEAMIDLEGVHLGATRSVKVKAATDAAVGSRVSLEIKTAKGKPLGDRSVIVGEFPEVLVQGDGVLTLPVPCTANGRIDRPGATGTWRFRATKGQQLILEVEARRLGSSLESYIEVLDANGQPVPRAVVRALAKTYVTFRDHDSSGAGIRIEAWSEFAINDFVYVGTELLRIKELPPNPDADCVFFSERGQRIGYLGTTPTHLSMGAPMYKVQVHPPGTTFSPNGFPVVTLYYRNDDAGPAFGRDARLTFDPPADGEYLVRIGDSRGQGGPGHAYRLTVRPPRPSYNVSFNPTSPAVWKGGAVPISVAAERIDGFEGTIAVRMEGLPPGFSAPATTVPAGENSTTFALWADTTAMSPGKTAMLKLVAEATINSQTMRKEVSGGVPTAVEPGDIATRTKESEVTVRPGAEVRLTVQVERRKGFTGRIPLDVRGLSHGIRVLDIGLNGILVTEQQTERTVAIYCEPWVTPGEHPFVVLARKEGSGQEFAARSVLLKVAAPSR